MEPTTEALSREIGRMPTLAELAKRLDVTTEQVLEAREAAGAYRAVSLDRPRDEDDESSDGIGAAIGVEDAGFSEAEDAATVAHLMRVLSEREREVLRLRFSEDLTQAEIGERIGVSQMHVSRIIRQAIARLREEAQQA
jgi:RNA polymerase sigma-B factor